MIGYGPFRRSKYATDPSWALEGIHGAYMSYKTVKQNKSNANKWQIIKTLQSNCEICELYTFILNVMGHSAYYDMHSRSVASMRSNSIFFLKIFFVQIWKLNWPIITKLFATFCGFSSMDQSNLANTNPQVEYRFVFFIYTNFQNLQIFCGFSSMDQSNLPKKPIQTHKSIIDLFFLFIQIFNFHRSYYKGLRPFSEL